MTPTPILDELERLTDGEPLATYHGQAGGEWDTLRVVPLRVRRRLTSAGFMHRHGVLPDVLCDIMRRNGCNAGDPIEVWLNLAKRAVPERRHAVDTDARRRLARRQGHASYYAYRTEQVRSAGYQSVWYYRKARGWT